MCLDIRMCLRRAHEIETGTERPAARQRDERGVEIDITDAGMSHSENRGLQGQTIGRQSCLIPSSAVKSVV
jgi:hypothetical protein